MNKIYFIPKAVANKIKEPVNLISIYDPYGSAPTFKVKHNLLSLGFINFHSGMGEFAEKRLISKEQVEKIVEFYNANKDGDIYVHCGEGSVRSPAIATFISWLAAFDDHPIRPSGLLDGHVGSDRHMCMRTVHRCREFHSEMLRATGEYLLTEEAMAIIKGRGESFDSLLDLNKYRRYRLVDGIYYKKSEILTHDMPTIKEFTKDSSDYYSPESQRVVVTEMVDCSSGGCDHCGYESKDD